METLTKSTDNHYPPLILLSFFLFVFIFNTKLYSQETDTSMTSIYAMSLEDLLDTKVTIATKSDQRISESPSIVSVITAEDIKNMGLRELEEVLSIIPGVEITHIKAGTKQPAVRGISAYNQGGRILVMIDGTPYNGIMYGAAIFFGANINIDNIKRIEVIRGPGSALYGRNAFSMVINIITKNAKSSEGVNLGLSYGSYNTYDIWGSIGIKKEKYNMYFSAKKFYTDATNEHYTDPTGKNELWNIYHDNYFINSNIEIGNISISGSYANIKDGISPGVFVNDSYNDKKVGLYSIAYSYDLSDRVNTRIKLYGRNENRIQFFETLKPNVHPQFPNGLYAIPEFNSYVYGSELEANFKISKNHELLIGLQADMHGIKDATIKANYDFYNVDTTTGLPLTLTYTIDDSTYHYTKDNLPTFTGSDGWIDNGGHNYSNMALFVQDVYYPFKNIGLTLGGRFDIDSEIGYVFNPRLGLVVGFLKKFNVKLLYGQAYRVPSCSEQYKLTGADIGNKNLNHEQIRTSEIAISIKEKKYFAQVSSFYNYAKDLTVRSLTDKKYYNLGYNNSYGFELEQKFFINENISTFSNYSFIISKNSEKINGDTRTFDAPNMSKHKFNIGVNYEIFKNFVFNSLFKYQGPITKFTKLNAETGEYEPVSQQEVGDVFLLNSTLQYTILESINISASAYNILDQEYYYQDTDSPNQPKQNGINFLVRIQYSF